MELEERVRKASVEDLKKIKSISYSAIEKYINCPYNYKLHYVDNKKCPQDAIHLDIGTLCHKVLELKGRAKIKKEPIDYRYLADVFLEGIEEKTDKGLEKIHGLKDLYDKWGIFLFLEKDSEGISYEEKLKKFNESVILKELEDEWECLETEKEFNIVYTFDEENNKQIILHGYIDCIVGKFDTEGKLKEIKVIDYKTSKKTYDKSKLNSALQMFIYGLAIYSLYGMFPSEYEYHFILIDDRQKALEIDYKNICTKLLDDSLIKIQSDTEQKSEFKPKPSPLCYWCSYCNNNPNATIPYSAMCEYYSLWKPTDKIFVVNKKFTSSNTKIRKISW